MLWWGLQMSVCTKQAAEVLVTVTVCLTSLSPQALDVEILS